MNRTTPRPSVRGRALAIALSPSCRRAFTAALAAVGVLLTSTPTAFAASDTWLGSTDTLWATTTNWAAETVPGAGNTATFSESSVNTTIDLGSGVTLGALSFDSSNASAYTIGSGGAGIQTLTLDTVGNAITMDATVAANELINANLALATTGTYTVTNNSTTNALTLAGGISASTTGTKVLSLTGSGNTAISGAITAGSGAMNLLKTGTGTLTLSGGATIGAAAVTGYGGTFSAVLRGGETVISSGAYTSEGEFVLGGYQTAGETGVNTKLTLNGGSLTVNNWLSLGRGNGTGSVSSDLVLNNAATVTASNLSAGFNGGNTANLPKGSITLNGTSSFSVNTGDTSFFLAESAGSNFTMTLNDSSSVTINGSSTGSDAARQRSIGHLGTGTLNINGSASFSDVGTAALNVGYQNGTGVVNVNSGTFSHANGEVRVGGSDINGIQTGSGTINVSGGTATVGALTLARGNSNTSLINGTVNVSGGTLTSTGDVIVGYAGNGNLGKMTISGGTVNVGTTTTGKNLYLGYWDTSKGQVDIISGSLNLNTNASIKFTPGNTTTSGTNVINQSGGNVTFYSDNGVTAGGTGVLDMATLGAAASNNTYNLNGGTLTANQIKSSTLTNTRTFNFNGGTLKAASSTYASAFFNLGSGGTARANVRNGGALIDSNGVDVTIGQALVHSNVSGDNATDGGLTKSGTGILTLSGANTYNGNTTISAGTLAVSSTGSLLFDVADASSTQILGTGALTFDGTLKLNLSGVTVGSGSWSLINVGTLTESFAGTFAVADNSGTLTFTEASNVWTSNNGLWSFSEATGVLALSSVPEPSTYAALAGLGVFALATYRRRRNA